MSKPGTKTVVAELQLSDDQKSNYVAADAFPRLPESATLSWHTRVSISISLLSKRGDPFTVETVRSYGVEEPEHPSAWGAVFKQAKDNGVIVRTGFMNSPRKPRHGAMVSVWVGREAA